MARRAVGGLGAGRYVPQGGGLVAGLTPRCAPCQHPTSIAPKRFPPSNSGDWTLRADISRNFGGGCSSDSGPGKQEESKGSIGCRQRGGDRSVRERGDLRARLAATAGQPAPSLPLKTFQTNPQDSPVRARCARLPSGSGRIRKFSAIRRKTEEGEVPHFVWRLLSKHTPGDV